MRKVLTIIIVLVLLGAGVFVFISTRKEALPPEKEPVATSTEPVHRTIGTSVDGRTIDAYTYGTGPTHLLFVGGMHGGYEWNSVLLAYDFMDYFTAHPEAIPDTLSITIVPSANPDGVFKVIGKEGRFTLADVPSTVSGPAGTGRFNADNVDLNRNFDCHWQATSTWQGNPVSAGTAPFSEPEARAIRDLVLSTHPVGVVFWHSAANAVYAAECDNGVLPSDLTLMNTYANAAGYQAVKTFDAYPVTGDSEGWLSSIGIPAITVEMSSHDSVEWNKNFAGVEAMIAAYATGTADGVMTK